MLVWPASQKQYSVLHRKNERNSLCGATEVADACSTFELPGVLETPGPKGQIQFKTTINHFKTTSPGQDLNLHPCELDAGVASKPEQVQFISKR